MGRPPGPSSSVKSKESPSFRRAQQTFRNRIRELRRMHGLSYRELHERSGVHWRQLLGIEKSKPVNPTLVTLTRLADALGVEPFELITPATSEIRSAQPDRGADIADLTDASPAGTREPEASKKKRSAH